jgi:NTE family protein
MCTKHLKTERTFSIYIGIILLLFLLVLPKTTAAQTRPKVGLCLSGGGAKGLAHIGLLKLIDSLNIKIDYVTGTSMGAVVGGLYASGWSGKQIDSLAHTLDWSVLLNQYVPMKEINIDEKDEFQNYIGEIPIKKGKIQLNGFLDGQTLIRILTKLTRHVNHISDFDKLPIPYRCMAVDINTVTPVLLKSGDLVMAMRASMSIPTVFKPIKIDSFLLVDGGVLNNFPVKELKEMGADFIIGSYTGGRLLDESELNTVDKILLQTSFFHSINESKEAIKLCDIFNNLTDNMKKISGGAFNSSNKIIKIGNQIAHKVLPQLMDLAAQQKTSGLNFHKEDLVVHNDTILINNLFVESNSNEIDGKFIKHNIDFQNEDAVSYDDLDNSIKKIYAHRNLYRAYYTSEQIDSHRFDIHYKVVKDANYKFKGALRYDTEFGAGFILNFTARNFLGKNSRLVATVALAESPKYRIHYRKYLFSTNLSINTVLSRDRDIVTVYTPNGASDNSFINVYRKFDLGLNYALNTNSSTYLGITSDISNFKPRYAQTNTLGINLIALEDITFGANWLYKYNTLDRRFFPRKGVDFSIENKFILISAQELSTKTITIENGSITTTDALNRTSFSNPHDKIKGKINVYLPISKRLTCAINAHIGITVPNVIDINVENSTLDSTFIFSNEIPITQSYFVGGVEQRSRNSLTPLMGLREGEYTIQNFAALQIGFQYELTKKLLVTPTFSFCYGSNSLKTFGSNFKNIQFDNSPLLDNGTFNNFYAYGISLGYRTPIGPIIINVSKSSFANDLRYYLGVGYLF